MREATDRKTGSTQRSYLVGILLVLSAAVLWSLNGVLIKLIYDGGRGPGGVAIAFYRSLLAGLFLLPLARGKFRTLLRSGSASDAEPGAAVRRWPFRIRPAAIACVAFFTLMTVCFVVANTKTEAANAIILQYTSTCWVFCLSPFILHEHPRKRDLWVLALAVLGIAVIFAGNAAAGLFGLMNALAAGLFYALLTMMLRLLRDADAAAATVMNNLGSALLILPFVIVAGGFVVSQRAFLLLAVMGVVQFGIPYWLFSLGIARIPAYQAALITLAEPILVPVWTYLVLEEQVPGATMVGGAIVLAALVLLAVMSRRAGGSPKKSEPPGSMGEPRSAGDVPAKRGECT